MRALNWMTADDAINEHNSDPQATSSVAHNHLSALSGEELKKMKGLNTKVSSVDPSLTDYSLTGTPTANEVDWVSEGKVTPV